MTPGSHIDVRKEIHYNIYGGRHQERKKPTMKDNKGNKTTTKTTVVNDYFSMTRDDMPSWMYPALNREAWDEYSGKLEKGLRRYAHDSVFIGALTWFYGIKVSMGQFLTVSSELDDVDLEMQEYTDGHAKAPMALLYVEVCDSRNGLPLDRFALEMTWVDYYFVMARANALLAGLPEVGGYTYDTPRGKRYNEYNEDILDATREESGECTVGFDH